jgi:hypothetical protein
VLIRKCYLELLLLSTGRLLTKTALVNWANACRCFHFLSNTRLIPCYDSYSFSHYSQTAQPELFVVYEPTTEQTLVVNRRLLRERLAETVLFIEVGGKEPALVGPLGRPDVCSYDSLGFVCICSSRLPR